VSDLTADGGRGSVAARRVQRVEAMVLLVIGRGGGRGRRRVAVRGGRVEGAIRRWRHHRRRW